MKYVNDLPKAQQKKLLGQVQLTAQLYLNQMVTIAETYEVDPAELYDYAKTYEDIFIEKNGFKGIAAISQKTVQGLLNILKTITNVRKQAEITARKMLQDET